MMAEKPHMLQLYGSTTVPTLHSRCHLLFRGVFVTIIKTTAINKDVLSPDRQKQIYLSSCFSFREMTVAQDSEKPNRNTIRCTTQLGPWASSPPPHPRGALCLGLSIILLECTDPDLRTGRGHRSICSHHLLLQMKYCEGHDS